MHNTGRWPALGILLMLAACDPGANLPPLPATAAAGSYRLGPGDVVRTITFDEPQLTGTFHVSDSGVLQFPLLGDVPVAGRTVGDVADAMTAELKHRDLLRHPSVSVEIATYRPIFVLGEVNHPGRYPFEPGMTVLSAVADAGGFTARAVKSVQSVTRADPAGPDHAVEWRAPRDARLAPGDVITVLERNF